MAEQLAAAQAAADELSSRLNEERTRRIQAEREAARGAVFSGVARDGARWGGENPADRGRENPLEALADDRSAAYPSGTGSSSPFDARASVAERRAAAAEARVLRLRNELEVSERAARVRGVGGCRVRHARGLPRVFGLSVAGYVVVSARRGAWWEKGAWHTRSTGCRTLAVLDRAIEESAPGCRTCPWCMVELNLCFRLERAHLKITCASSTLAATHALVRVGDGALSPPSPPSSSLHSPSAPPPAVAPLTTPLLLTP